MLSWLPSFLQIAFKDNEQCTTSNNQSRRKQGAVSENQQRDTQRFQVLELSDTDHKKMCTISEETKDEPENTCRKL